jgi:hypothetical protein
VYFGAENAKHTQHSIDTMLSCTASPQASLSMAIIAELELPHHRV